MATKKVARNGAGQVAEAALELARLPGNEAVLRELDARAHPLLKKMQATAEHARFLALDRSVRVRAICAFLEEAPDKLRASILIDRDIESLLHDAPWPTTPRGQRDIRAKSFPAFAPLTGEQLHFFKRQFADWVRSRNLTDRERRRLEAKYLRKLSPQASGADMLTEIVRFHGLKPAHVEELFAFERVEKSRATKGPSTK